MIATDNITLTVYPFEDLSVNKELNIFCRSFSIDLVTDLSKFRQFRVINGVHSLKNGESGETSHEAICDYFIEGSFRYDKDPLRINVQLYNGPTRHLVWANRLDGNLTEVSELQEKLLTE